VTALRRPLLVAALAPAVIALVTSAAVAVEVIDTPIAKEAPSPVSSSARGGVSPGGHGLPSGSSRTPRNRPGSVVNVALWDMGGPMLGPRDGMMDGRFMQLNVDHAVVPHGTVSFVVTNGGSITHEMVVLPDDHVFGTRPMGAEKVIDETGSLGEASKTGGKGAGRGIAPGSSSWLTITLKPGQYELVCNLPRHYTLGMHAQLTVT
jgi:uncharacterized cupredoxin-like copper-binding protein